MKKYQLKEWVQYLLLFIAGLCLMLIICVIENSIWQFIIDKIVLLVICFICLSLIDKYGNLE